MTARAPGKVVVSGAYAVLEGAPGLVAAVDRYVLADATRRADFVTEEVRAALGDELAPWFDAAALREADRKLGLGSSAAIVVASLAARWVEENGPADDRTLQEAVFGPALAAHRAAQSGGSGIDVAASVYGGVLWAKLESGVLSVQPATLPGALHLAVYAADVASSTAGLVALVRVLQQREPSHFSALMAALIRAAESARDAIEAASAPDFVRALEAQLEGLDALGSAAGAPIVTEATRVLAEAAKKTRGIALPAGAGGGDLVLYAGLEPPQSELDGVASAHRHRRLELRFGVRGVHATAE